MNKADFKYFTIISLIQSAIGQSGSYFDAIHAGVRVLVDNTCADYAVLWHCEGDEARPYYWLLPVDLTSARLSCAGGILKKCLSEDKSAAFADFSAEAPDEIKTQLRGTDIRSLAVTPFDFGGGERGFLFFISTETAFTDDDVSVFEILSLMTEISMRGSKCPFKTRPERKVVLKCRDIRKTFRNGEIVNDVLKGIDFDLFEGELLCLLGESGCGKSTFLNIIGGLERADAGTFEFMGREYQNASEDELTEYRRRNIGFIFQAYNLMPNLTSRQNLDLIGELSDDPMDSAKALDIVGLSQKMNSYPSQLSGGQQQRVSIARALVKKPRLIMADEPTAALDHNTSVEVLEVLANVVKSGTTIIMVTHNEEISKMADRVVRFRNGKVYEITVNDEPKQAKELVW